MSDIEKKIEELALLEQAWHERRLVVEAMRERMYKAYVEHYDVELEAMEKVIAGMRDEIKADALAYVSETGDLMKEIEGITFRRTKKRIYNRDEALAWCQENKPECVKTKVTLAVRMFEQVALEEYGHYEEVPDPTIAINKHLGDIAIRAKRKGASE